jgi:uroporphyrinogen decarboxylase
MSREHLTKRERLEATVAGAPVDRPAIALWRHWPGDDQRAADLAAAHVSWQQSYDFDLIKLTPTSAYCLQDWGIRTAWLGGDEGTRTYEAPVIKDQEDWNRLPVLDPNSGHLGEALKAVQLTCEALGEEIPVIMTIFSPLAQAKNLAGAQLLPHLRQHPEAVLAGLNTISQSVLRFIESLKAIGQGQRPNTPAIAGIFYAAQMATATHLSREEYLRFGRPFDLQILQATHDLWFNMLHIHGLNTYADLFVDYPVQAVNWHDREAGPPLEQGARLFPGALSGGLNRWTVHQGTPDQVRREAKNAITQTGGKRLILSTGCVVMTNSPISNLRAARKSVDPGQ